MKCKFLVFTTVLALASLASAATRDGDPDPIDSDTFGGQAPSYYAKQSDMTTAQADIILNAASAAVNKTDIGRNENNVIENRMLIMVNGTLVAGDLDDGWVDAFSDQSGVDVDSGSNFTYDVAGDYYSWAVLIGPYDTSTNIVIYYNLNDSNATTVVTDGSGSGRNGVASANTATTSVGGKLGAAFDPNATVYTTNAYTTAAWANQFDTESRSICAWMNSPDWDSGGGSARSAWSGGQAGHPSMYWGFQNDVAGTWRFCLFNDGGGQYLGEVGTSGCAGFTDNTWHHFVGVWDMSAKVMNLYIDGALDGSFTNASLGTVSNFGTDDPMTLGGFGQSGSILHKADQLIDDFRIYNKALTVAEVAEIYNSGAGRAALTGGASGGNMELISTNSFAADAIPTNAKLIIALEDVTGTATINTDVLGYVSSDGSNWDQVTLESIGTLTAGVNLYSGTNTLTGNNTNMAWKVVTANTTKAGRIHSAGMLWKEEN